MTGNITGTSAAGTPPSPAPAPAPPATDKQTPPAAGTSATPPPAAPKPEAPGAKDQGSKETPAPDTTGKTKGNEGPIPYERFKTVNDENKAYKARESSFDQFLSENPDIAEVITSRLRGDKPAPAQHQSKQQSQQQMQSMQGKDIAELRDSVLQQLTNDPDARYEDLDPFQRREVDREIENIQQQEASRETQRIENVSKLHNAIEELGKDPLFRGVEIDADALVEHMFMNGIANPKAALIHMHNEIILDRERREAADAALRRKNEASGAALPTDGDVSRAPGASSQPMSRLEEVVQRMHEIRARREKSKEN